VRHYDGGIGGQGGDDPEKAADLVAGLMSEAAASVNGQFLWIKNGLQAPIAS
jgi:hypothetical protein